MIHSQAYILRSVLIYLSQASAPSSQTTWPVFVDNEPNLPDNCITVYNTAGTEDGRAMISGLLFDHEGLQIRVRSVDHPTGWNKLREIRDAISMSVRNLFLTVEGEPYRVNAVTRIQDVIPIGTEQTSKRLLFTLNCTISFNKL